MNTTRSNPIGLSHCEGDGGVDVGYTTTIDKDVAGLMDLRDLRARLCHKASREDVIALNGAIHDLQNTKVGQAEFCALQNIVTLKANEADLCVVKQALVSKASDAELCNVKNLLALKASDADLCNVKNAIAHLATQNDLCALQASLSHKANQADICTVQAQIAALTCEVARKADKCDLLRTQDGLASLANGQAAFALKYEVQALQGSVQGITNNIAAVAAVDNGCEVYFDKRLTHLARALAAIHCGIRDDRVRVDTLIAAVSDPATKIALQALADSVFARWEQILIQFVSITHGCDGGYAA